MNETSILQRARDVLNIEIKGISALIERLDENFIRAVELIHHCRGKIVVTGLGKSGLICRKIAATLSSTGTPAFARCAAICAPMVPAPSTAALRNGEDMGGS